MIFTFKDNSTKEYLVGTKCRGLKQNGLRPISVSFSSTDLDNLFKLEHPIQYLTHIHNTLHR